MAFKGKAPGSGSGEMSSRTLRLRPAIGLTPKQIAVVRRLRRSGLEPDAISSGTGLPRDEIEKALLQMRSARPETTRGTLNVTLAAHRLIMAERAGDEPVWVTMDRLLDELLRLRAATARRQRSRPARQPDLLAPLPPPPDGGRAPRSDPDRT